MTPPSPVRQLLVNCRPEQRRVALIEGGITRELYFERIDSLRLTGNIYKGRVVRVLPGMQSAFVEMGLQRTAFLHVTDAYPADAQTDEGSDGKRKHPPISSLVREGQEILVQVAKEPLGQKGARITTHLSLPGRHVVLRPDASGVGVSRRIGDPAERARLQAIAESLVPEGAGLIVRTVAEGADEGELAHDVEFLTSLWRDIATRGREVSAPALVHADLDIALRSVRDVLGNGSSHRVLVDDEAEARRILDFISRFVPQFEGTVETWPGPDPLFERFGLEWEISRAVRRRVWLKSGGYIAIDQAEALTAVDVNSGKNVGKSSFDDTILETNLEAAREIAYQLRLRDIGGIIVIDFIDMATAAHKQRVYESLLEALHEDRSRTRVYPPSALGLVEMTRKRARESIVQGLTDSCFYCEGRGYLRSIQVITDSIISRLRQLVVSGASGALTIVAHPRVIDSLVDECQATLSALEERHGLEINLQAKDDQHLEVVDIE